jgi:hypothetical protein
MMGQSYYTQNFKVRFENKCVRLLVDAYNQSVTEKTIQLNWEETDITSQLREFIEKNPLKTIWEISCNVDPHLHNNRGKKEKGFAKKERKVDLSFVKFQQRLFQSNKEHVVFAEAKNLKENDSKLKRRYIDTGMGNFISGIYPLGFLVGYFLEGNVHATIEGINHMLNKDNREKDCLHPKKHAIVRYYCESYHYDLCIKHLIFDLTTL